MATDIPFSNQLDFTYGEMARISPMIRRVVANNPSHFTLHGTSTYIIGQGRVAVLDPGPALPDHVDAILAGLEGETISHILVTHTHQDHSPACALLQNAPAASGAKTHGYGPHGAGKREQGIQVEEGGDMDFRPQVEVRHGDVIEGEGWSVECVYTPGHTSNHICFHLREENTLFSGDHVMGWSTSVISPPDGDMAQYMASLRLLLEREDAIYLPAHGPAITEPKPFVRAFIAHREDREAQILDCLAKGIDTITAMVPIMYAGLPRGLYPAAARSVYAHIIQMTEDGRVACAGELALDAAYGVPGR